jgi:hypothetical protein
VRAERKVLFKFKARKKRLHKGVSCLTGLKIAKAELSVPVQFKSLCWKKKFTYPKAENSVFVSLFIGFVKLASYSEEFIRLILTTSIRNAALEIYLFLINLRENYQKNKV